MDKGVQIILGCGGTILYAVVTFVLTFAADYALCWAAWRVTGNDGYMRVGWVFAFLAWPVVFAGGAIGIARVLKRRERRLRERGGFAVVFHRSEQ